LGQAKVGVVGVADLLALCVGLAGQLSVGGVGIAVPFSVLVALVRYLPL